MIPLSARTRPSGWIAPSTDVWRVVEGDAGGTTWRLQAADRSDAFGILATTNQAYDGPGPTLHLPPQLSHLTVGDVLVVAADGTRVSVAWKDAATHNSILLTERCDNYCLMCSQPPKDRDDSFLYARAQRIVSALPAGARAISLTGGEPTTDREAFLALLEHCAVAAPELAVHILSNGRSFADRDFAQSYADVPLGDAMVGIPLYAAEPGLHDFVVQARGAFDETVRGICSLADVGARVEVRVVLQAQSVPVLTEIARYVVRNVPFVEQVALMGLEMTGLARPNSALVWADPVDYQEELRSAYFVLRDAGIRTSIYNLPLCVLDTELWPAAVRSISDWKNDYTEVCRPCTVRDLCAGVFTTSGNRLSRGIAPIFA